MNALPNISNSLSTQTAPVTGTNPMQANMLSANQTSAHPLFMGSANLPTRELVARTLTLPPLAFTSTFETSQTSQQKPDITLAMGEFKIGGIDHTEHELTSVGKQAVFPSNHAPESWLSNDMNPLYMGPSPSLRNSHFIGGGADETMLSFLPDDLSPAALQNLSRESLKKFEQIRDSYTTEIQIPTGAWRGQEIIRVTINTIPNLRMASGNESGANKYWMPGGYLPNGLPEAVCDQIPLANISKTAFTPN
nr:hypothetical protein [Oxalobacteraceae bacterium]